MNLTWTLVLIIVAVFFLFFWGRIKKLKHKLMFVFLLALFLFGYFSINSAFDGKQIDLTDFHGVSDAFGIYFSWLGNVFDSTGTITSNAVANNSVEVKGK